VNLSYWDNILEGKSGKYCAIRLGFRQVKGLHEADLKLLVANRGAGYRNVQSVMDAGVTQAVLERLADADAFRSMGLDRRQALWQVAALADRPNGMYEGQLPESQREEGIELPAMSLPEHVLQDYGATGLSVKAHPVAFVREKLTMLGNVRTADLLQCNDGATVKVSGLVLVRQRPGTASGICFITIEDESGTANLVVFKKLFDKYRKEIVRARLLMVEGKVQKEGEVIHVVVKRCHDVSVLLGQMTERAPAKLPVMPLSRADEGMDDPDRYTEKDQRVKKVIQADLFHGGRNFR
jgi:error-prone DNA polymerase